MAVSAWAERQDQVPSGGAFLEVLGWRERRRGWSLLTLMHLRGADGKRSWRPRDKAVSAVTAGSEGLRRRLFFR